MINTPTQFQNNVTNQESNAISLEREPPITLRIAVVNPSFILRLMIRLKLLTGKKNFIIPALCLGTIAEISKLFLEIQPSGYNGESELLNANYHLMIQHKNAIATIIALAVVNRQKRPSKRLIKFFIQNLSMQETMQALQVVVKQINVPAFMRAVIIMRGLNILRHTN